MPIIRGVKMACEPCIRGHRSTKCQHAKDRIMVPVRKPGRPLSACPHPREHICGCGGVTAAIPRNQACGCGISQLSLQTSASVLEPAASEFTSPTRSSFKVQKNGRPSSSRQQSYDAANLERMDLNNIRVNSFGSIASPPINSLTEARKDLLDGQYQEIERQLPTSSLLDENGRPTSSADSNSNNSMRDWSKDMSKWNGFSPSNGSTMPQIFGHQRSNSSTPPNGVTNGPTKMRSSCCGPQASPTPIAEADSKPPVSSCCQPQNGESSNGIGRKVIPAAPSGSCCSSTPNPIKGEPIMTPQIPHQILQQPIGLGQNYPQYAAQPTVWAYPSSIGTFLNPIQQDAWQQSVIANMYTIPQGTPQTLLGGFEMPVGSGGISTIHSCSCGPSCQCYGCLAHPYNETTMNRISSTYRLMYGEPSNNTYNGNPVIPNDTITALSNGHNLHNIQNGQNSQNGHNVQIGEDVQNGHGHNVDITSSPISTGSASQGEDDRILPETDFFFVNYPNPLQGNGCGGDQYSCPCGDECECIGCSIHNNSGLVA